VKTLLSLGANPNFTNEHAESYAMAAAVHGSVLLLRTMLDAGGNPNALDPEGRAIIFANWNLSYFEGDQRARLELLLNRGADVNATIPDSESYNAGYTLLLHRAAAGRGDAQAYADARLLLERGADFKRAAKDGTTLMQMLQEHRAFYSPEVGPPPPEFELLWQWLVARDPIPVPQ
jgi:ankyrin repeat protein